MSSNWFNPWIYAPNDEEELKPANKDADTICIRCECGAEYTCAPQFHYDWCPMYKKE
jgi:hypothetical protein